jgi:hypothetical protein
MGDVTMALAPAPAHTLPGVGAFVLQIHLCIAAGLVGGEGFAVNASLIEADANYCGDLHS